MADKFKLKVDIRTGKKVYFHPKVWVGVGIGPAIFISGVIRRVLLEDVKYLVDVEVYENNKVLKLLYGK